MAECRAAAQGQARTCLTGLSADVSLAAIAPASVLPAPISPARLAPALVFLTFCLLAILLSWGDVSPAQAREGQAREEPGREQGTAQGADEMRQGRDAGRDSGRGEPAGGQAADGSGTAGTQEERQRAERARELNLAMEQLLPLEPGEVRTYLDRRDAIDDAIAPGPARMRTRTRTLSATSLASAPCLVHLTAGYSSTLLLQDSTGAPWPVLSVLLGNAQAFAVSQPRVEQEIIQEEDAKKVPGSGRRNVHSHIVNIVPLTGHASSNMVLTLEGAPYPVLLHLVTESSRKPDRRSDALLVLRLDRPGPAARKALLGPAPTTADRRLLDFVHGLAPAGARRVPCSPALPGVQVWAWQGRHYVRSVHQAVWPAWESQAESDGVTLYVMPQTPSLLLSVQGGMQSVRLDRERAGPAGRASARADESGADGRTGRGTGNRTGGATGPEEDAVWP